MTSIDEDIIATLRARVAELERHAWLLRDSRAKACGTLASVAAALDGQPVSEGEPEVVQRVARVVAELAEARAGLVAAGEMETRFINGGGDARERDRLTAELAEARRIYPVVEQELNDLRTHMAERIAAARAEGAREEREACLGDLEYEMSAHPSVSRERLALDAADKRIRARGEGGPT